MEFVTSVERRLPAVALLFGLSATALAGCGAGPAEVLPDRPGTVVERDYTAPYTKITKVGNVSVPEYHPADYDLAVRQCNRENDPNADEKGCVTAWVDVDQQTYERHPDGSTIVFPSNK